MGSELHIKRDNYVAVNNSNNLFVLNVQKLHENDFGKKGGKSSITNTVFIVTIKKKI